MINLVSPNDDILGDGNDGHIDGVGWLYLWYDNRFDGGTDYQTGKFSAGSINVHAL